jgi:hypothetical protein
MMGMNGMAERCMDAMGSMMDGGLMLVLLFVLLLVWLVGLGAVGALIFWSVRRLSNEQVGAMINDIPRRTGG